MIKKRKKAQFYIMAAVIISGIIVAFAITLNVSQKSEFNELYDLGDELKMESEEVLDYGVYNKTDNEGMNDLLMDFTEIYTIYKGNEKDLYFVFGNRTKITVAGYIDEGMEDEDVLRTITLKDDSGDELGNMEIDDDGDYVYEQYDISPSMDEIIIQVEDIQYHFELKGKEYFYFIINKKIDGQHYIISNER